MAKQIGKDKKGEASKNSQNGKAQSTQANVASWIPEIRPKKISYSYRGISEIFDRAYHSGVYMDLKDTVDSEKLRRHRQAPSPSPDASVKHCAQHDRATFLKESALDANSLNDGDVAVQEGNAKQTHVFSLSPFTEGNALSKDNDSKTAELLSLKLRNSVVFNTTRNDLPNCSQNREALYQI